MKLSDREFNKICCEIRQHILDGTAAWDKVLRQVDLYAVKYGRTLIRQVCIRNNAREELTRLRTLGLATPLIEGD